MQGVCFLCVCVLQLVHSEGLGWGLISVYCNMSTNH